MKEESRKLPDKGRGALKAAEILLREGDAEFAAEFVIQGQLTAVVRRFSENVNKSRTYPIFPHKVRKGREAVREGRTVAIHELKREVESW